MITCMIIICKHYQKVMINEWKYTNLTNIWVNLTLFYSLRAVYGTDDQRNALHGSDSFSSSEKEIRFFFPDSKWLCFVSNWCPVTCNIMCFECEILKSFSIKIFTHHLLIESCGVELCRCDWTSPHWASCQRLPG